MNFTCKVFSIADKIFFEGVVLIQVLRHHVNITSKEMQKAFHWLHFEAGFLDPVVAICSDVIFSRLIVIYASGI